MTSPGSDAPAVGVVLVSYNTRDLLLRSLRSLPWGDAAIPLQAVVVDNASRDGSADAVVAEFPSVAVVRNPRNFGYAAAANQGWRACAAPRVLFLNPDAELSPGALAALARGLDAPGVGLAGAALRDPDGAPQHSFDQIPSLATELVGKSLLRRLAPGRYPSRLQERGEPFDVESLVGACMMARREVLEALGGFDEGYFLFLEETDLCKRARERGWAVRVIPQAACRHLQGASAKQDHGASRVEYYRSRYRFFRLHGSPAARTLLPAGLFLRLCVTVAAHGLAAPLCARSAARFAANLRVLLWHLAGRPPRSGGVDRPTLPSTPR